jgi:RND family efflux transporter MFP subunit
MFKKIGVWKKNHAKLFWVIVVLVVLAIWRIWANSNKAIEIQTVKITTGKLVQVVSTSGTVKADQYSVLTFPSGGKIAGVWVKPGDIVRKGARIAALDTIPLNAAYQQAQNTYKNYQAIADQVLDSVKGHAGDENFTQRAVRTTAETNRDSAYNAVLAARANLSNAVIFAPFSGIIDTAIPSSPGILVGPGIANYALINPETVYFDAEVEETDLPYIARGQQVKIKLDAYPDDTYDGLVSNVGMVAFPSTTGGNAYHIRIGLPKNTNLKFRVGMRGDSDVVYNTVNSVLKVPSSAITELNGKTYVWLVDNKKAKKQEVQTGKIAEEEIEITSGVSDGVEIIDNAPATLREGDKIKIANQ